METLIFIPTYNERGNVERLCEQISLLIEADLLFVDDNSPDGTGEVLDLLAKKYTNLTVIHRQGKLGIGTAHQTGIAYAYDRGYDTLISLDCDGTHPPEYIPQFLSENNIPVAVGSRYLQKNSLAEWTWLRRFMTHGGHFLTSHLLGMPYDASSAYRCYWLNHIPRQLFTLVKAEGYGFFFESLYALHINGFPIHEIPIVLPARGSGESKMSFIEAYKGIRRLFSLWANVTRHRAYYKLNVAQTI
jgi:dolichol-phosphate mannosyltransferase